MTDDLSAKGRIEVELVNARKAISELHAIREELATGQVDADKYEKALRGVEGALGKIATATGRSRTQAAAQRDVASATEGAATSTARAATSVRSLASANDSIISQRYALYDVATTYGAIGAALLGIDLYAVTMAAKFEQAFTQVERTLESGQTPASIAAIREELVELSTQIPLTFAEISKIAQLGNQLGVQAQNITKFTTTVAQFSAVTGISVEETALAFGQIGNLLGVAEDQYDRFGSAIALVGVNSAATETQIVSIAREIAPAARAAGFTADQVIGLSGALGSIRVPPERSRSTILQFFETLNMAVAKGGDDLENFSAVVGVTAAELTSMVRTGQGESIFRRFIDRAAAADTVQITQALDALGLAGLRTNPTIRALADNTALLDQTFSDASKGFGENTELARQYALIADDLASKFQMLVNSVNALIDAATGGQVSGLAGVVQLLIDMTNAARGFVESEPGQVLSKFVLIAVGAIGVFTALRAAQALATASTYALVTAQASLNASTGLTGIRGLISALFGYTKVANGATVSTLTLAGALRTLAKSTLVLAALQLAYEILFDLGGLMNSLRGPLVALASPIQAITSLFAGLARAGGVVYSFIGQMIPPLAGLTDALATVARVASIAFSVVSGVSTGANFNRAIDSYNGVTTSIDKTRKSLSSAGLGANDFTDAIDGIGKSAGGAARQVRTLVDYGNDLSQVFQRAFGIRFGGQQGLDQITRGWREIAEAIDEARLRAMELEAQISELTADRATREFWLSVAIEYDDELRAGELRAEIAKIDSDLAKASKDLSKQQAKTNKTLVGNSDAAIENRQEILALVSSYQDYVATLASSGLSQDELRARNAQLKQDFLSQAQALGYNANELGIYAAAFDDVTTAINRVPRNITVASNTDPAMQALNELEARLQKMGSQTYGGGTVAAPNTAALEAAGAAAGASFKRGFQVGFNGALLYADGTGAFRGSAGSMKFYAGGGYTGNGGRYQPAGVVHGGEYVFSAPAVRAIGVGNLEQAHNAAKSGRGTGIGAGTGYVQLSPFDRQLLMNIADNIGITIPASTLAGATSASNANQASRRTA